MDRMRGGEGTLVGLWTTDYGLRMRDICFRTPLFEQGGEFFREGGELGGGEVESPEKADERRGFGADCGVRNVECGMRGRSQDAGEGFQDFRGETFGSLGHGDAGVKIE